MCVLCRRVVAGDSCHARLSVSFSRLTEPLRLSYRLMGNLLFDLDPLALSVFVSELVRISIAEVNGSVA